MVDQARTWGFMEENGFDFIVTGEVVGQRPKSQRRDTMPLIARESGAKDRLLRPLTALNLPPTLPEREGWVNREHLYGFHGLNRKPQIELAARFGFEEFAQPAGGCCFLTDAKYSAKLADLWHARGQRDYSLDDIMLLKVGRHLCPADHFKAIVARDDGENNFLEGYRKQFVYLRIDSQGSADADRRSSVVCRHRTRGTDRRPLWPGPRRRRRAGVGTSSERRSGNVGDRADGAASDSGRLACVAAKPPTSRCSTTRSDLSDAGHSHTGSSQDAAVGSTAEIVDRPRRVARHSGVVSRPWS